MNELREAQNSAIKYLRGLKKLDQEVVERIIENALKRGEIPIKAAVLNTIRVEKHRKRETEKKDKKMQKEVREKPHAVKDYLQSNTEYTNALEFAVEVAIGGLFAKESKNFILKRHTRIKELMEKLEGLLRENG